MDIPSLFMIPSAVSSGKVHSVFPNSTDADFDFNRDSDATRVNSEGLIERVGYYGSELILNGNFATDSNWIKGPGWTIANGKATITNSGVSSIYQDVLDLSKSYKVTFEITEISSGSLRFGIGVTFSDFFTQVGTYTFYGQPSSDTLFRINPSSGTNASIDNVSVKEITGDRARLNYEIEGGLVNTKPSLLLEPQSTNRFLYSEDLTQYNLSSTGTNSSNPIITSNYAISPDGTRNADRVQFNAGTDSSGNSRITETFTIFGTTETISVYLKSNDGQEHTIDIIQSNQPQDTVTVTSEWQRFSFTRVNSSPDKYGIGLTGSNAETADILAWGFQLEQQSYATSYIPTNGSTQTRAAETCNGAGTSSIFESSEGILYCEIEIPNISTTNSYPIAIFGTGATIQIYYRSASQSISFLSSVGGIQYLFHSTVNPLGKHKLALAYKQGRYSAYIDGSLVNRQNSGNVPSNGTLNTLSLADSGSSSFFGKVQDVRVYNTKEMTDSEVDILLTKITS